MNPFGLVPIAIGIFFLIGSLRDWDWFIDNTGPLLTRILGRDGARGFLTIIGLCFIGIGVFILLID